MASKSFRDNSRNSTVNQSYVQKQHSGFNDKDNNPDILTSELTNQHSNDKQTEQKDEKKQPITKKTIVDFTKNEAVPTER